MADEKGSDKKGDNDKEKEVLIPTAHNIQKTLDTVEKAYAEFNQKLNDKTALRDSVKVTLAETSGLNEKIKVMEKIMSFLLESEWKQKQLQGANDFTLLLERILESQNAQGDTGGDKKGGAATPPAAAPAGKPA